MEQKSEEPLQMPELDTGNLSAEIERDTQKTSCSKFEEIQILNPAERQKRFNSRCS